MDPRLPGRAGAAVDAAGQVRRDPAPDRGPAGRPERPVRGEEDTPGAVPGAGPEGLSTPLQAGLPGCLRREGRTPRPARLRDRRGPARGDVAGGAALRQVPAALP